MAWIELHQEVFRHPKVLRVAATLRVSNETAVGHIAALWCWALDAKPDGGPLGDIDIRAGANWSTRKDITAALLDAGLIDQHADGYWLHDWDDYAGRLLRQRAEAKERMRNVRARSTNVPERARTFMVTQQNRTEQNTTEPSVCLTGAQETLRVKLHDLARERVFGGVNAPDTDWCEDLIRRGATESDIEAATDASRRKSLAYCRAVLERRVKEREAGNDPDAVQASVSGAASRGGYSGSRGKGRMGGGGQGSDSFDDFDDAPPNSIRAGGGDLPGPREPQEVPGEAAGDRITHFPGRAQAGGGAR
jgi:hypothetical protein